MTSMFLEENVSIGLWNREVESDSPTICTSMVVFLWEGQTYSAHTGPPVLAVWVFPGATMPS